MTGPDRPLPPRAFLLLAAAAAGFTVYGSLVPFEYRPRPFDDAVAAFQRQMVARIIPASKADFAANLLLGLPLGFGLLASLRLDRPASAARTACYALAVWPLTVLFPVAVEFAQLYCPTRTCSGSDVLAQSLGAAAGMGLWAARGQRIVNWLRGVWTSKRAGGPAGRLLVLYLGLMALAQLLPLDLTASPGEVYWLKWKSGRTTLVPFADWEPGKPAVWCELAGLYAVAGLLAAAAGLRGWRVPAFTLALAVGLEAAQLLVKSRFSSATDVLIGTAAATAGYAVGRMMAGRTVTVEVGLVLGQLWAIGLLVGGWLPFDFDPALAAPRLAQVEWIPLASAVERNYLSGLEQLLVRVLLSAPVGAAAVAVGGRAWAGAVFAAAVSALMETGQLMLPTRYGGPTEVLAAAVGGWLGATAAWRLSQPLAASRDAGQAQ